MGVKVAELDWFGHLPDIYCPACGSRIFPIPVTDLEHMQCEHLVFIYWEGFQDVSPDYIELLDEMHRKAKKENANVLELVLDRLDSKRVLCFSITIRYGPASDIVYIAIDFLAGL